MTTMACLFGQPKWRLGRCWENVFYFKQFQSFESSLGNADKHRAAAPISTCTDMHADLSFPGFVNKLLKRAQLDQTQMSYFSQSSNMKLISQAFTSSTCSPTNYEFLELLGDANLNCAIVEYLRRRFPHLNNPDGVKIIARLKIDWVSKDKFSHYANLLGFEHFVRCSNEQRLNGRVKRSVMEDCFEAFCGALVMICDTQRQFSGYKHCYNFISDLMNNETISLRNEDLFDAKTRLKELFDVLKTHTIEYEYVVPNTLVNSSPTNALIKTNIWVVEIATGKRFLSASAQARTKKVSGQLAAKASIIDLKARGLFIETINS